MTKLQSSIVAANLIFIETRLLVFKLITIVPSGFLFGRLPSRRCGRFVKFTQISFFANRFVLIDFFKTRSDK